MIKWKEYYNATIQDSCSLILKKFFELGLDNDIVQKHAIDLGCGSGNDTICLLKNGYYVTSVDKEKDVIEIINNRISPNAKLKFIIDKFGGVKLPKANLVVANFSIPFCNPQYFKKFCKEVTDCIEVNGYFVGNFLGKEDEWNNDTNKTFVDKQDIDKIFEGFDIIYFKEKKYNKKKKSTGKMKFWHVYEVIAG